MIYEKKVKTNIPIIGVLTQPYLITDESKEFSSDTKMKNSYIPSSHIKFLEAAGARVVPVSYRYSYKKLKSTLKQLNGIYIPGDTNVILKNAKYMDTVSKILELAQDKNLNDHFPLLAVSYGYLALIQ
jgi:gamma-glutamyl hydrolase